MSELDAQQRAAVNTTAERVVVIAGPGSGKTRVLVERLKRAIAIGAEPDKILCITYTVAAARELSERLAPADLGHCGTLHSFCLKLVRHHHTKLCLPERVSVVDKETALELARDIAGEMGITMSDKALQACIDEYDAELSEARSKKALIAMETHTRLHCAGLLTFDSLLRAGLQLMSLRSVYWPYTHLFWDEAQDGADLDWNILHAIACQYKFVVGDPDQGIFSFRGAKVQRFFNLCASIKVAGVECNWEMRKLETNYRAERSGLVEAAEKLINNNENHVPRNIKFKRKGDILLATTAYFDGEEHGAIYEEIESIKAHICSLLVIGKTEYKLEANKRIAILCRTNWQVEQFARALVAAGVQCLRQRGPIHDIEMHKAKLLAGLLADPSNDLLCFRLLKITAHNDAEDIRSKAAKEMKSVFQVAREQGFFPPDDCDMPSVLAPQAFSAVCEAVSLTGDGRAGWTVRQVDWDKVLLCLESKEQIPAQQDYGVYVGTIHSAKGRMGPCFYSRA